MYLLLEFEDAIFNLIIRVSMDNGYFEFENYMLNILSREGICKVFSFFFYI